VLRHRLVWAFKPGRAIDFLPSLLAERSSFSDLMKVRAACCLLPKIRILEVRMQRQDGAVRLRAPQEIQASQFGNKLGPDDPDVQQIGGLLKQMCAALDEIRAHVVKQRKQFHTVDEIAELTGRSPYTVRRWVTEGRIAATRVQGTGPRGRLLISHDQIGRLIDAGLGSEVPTAASER
jgi:excisionase family DNA binding protein